MQNQVSWTRSWLVVTHPWVLSPALWSRGHYTTRVDRWWNVPDGCCPLSLNWIVWLWRTTEWLVSVAWSVTRSLVSDGRVINEHEHSGNKYHTLLFFYILYTLTTCIAHFPDDSVLWRRQHHAPLPWTRPPRPHTPPIPAASSCQSPCRGITAPTKSD